MAAFLAQLLSTLGVLRLLGPALAIAVAVTLIAGLARAEHDDGRRRGDVPGLRPPPAARRTAEPVADACLLLTMSVPRCLASVWDVVIPVGGSSGKARAQVSG